MLNGLLSFLKPLNRDDIEWRLPFRDADCGELVAHENGGGSGTGIDQNTCRITLTVQRTDEFVRRYLLDR